MISSEKIKLVPKGADGGHMELIGLSLFAGAGIGEAYLKDCGINMAVANELKVDRARMHEHLYPACRMIQGDISEPEVYSEIICCARKAGCNFVIATPPCQGMSSAGRKKKDDKRNRLIIYAAEAIKELKPEFVILENVPEQLQTKILIEDSWVLIPEYLKGLLGEEYIFNINNIVNTMNYGIPQSRERCVILMARKEHGIRWEFPAPSEKIITLREAIGGLPSLDPDVTDITDSQKKQFFPDYEKKKEAGAMVSQWHYPPRHKWRHVEALMHTPEGCSAWNNETYYPKLKDGTKGKGYKNTYKRQWWHKPAYTITKYTSRLGSQENGHPGRAIVDSPDETGRLWSDARVFSIYELMLVSSLPPDWNIPTWASSNLIREVIGEGVPPKLILTAVEQLDKKMDKGVSN